MSNSVDPTQFESCSNCGATLAPDTKQCPSCNMAVVKPGLPPTRTPRARRHLRHLLLATILLMLPHVPQVWKQWCEETGLTVIKQFGDGLWDVAYLPLVPKSLQFATFGFPALLQVLTRTTWMPLSLGVNQINIVRKFPKR